jgi:hypothetical protein
LKAPPPPLTWSTDDGRVPSAVAPGVAAVLMTWKVKVTVWPVETSVG